MRSGGDCERSDGEERHDETAEHECTSLWTFATFEVYEVGGEPVQ